MRWLLVFGLAGSVGCSSETPQGPSGSPPPPLPVTITGITTDSDTGEPLEGVRLCSDWDWRDCASSGPDGRYSFTANRSPNRALAPHPCLSASKNGFEPRAACPAFDGAGVLRSNYVLQRRLTVSGGQTLSGVVSVKDGFGEEWVSCDGCRAVGIDVPGPGTVGFRLLSATPGTRLDLARSGKSLGSDGTLEASEAGQMSAAIWLMSGNGPVHFTLATTFTPR